MTFEEKNNILNTCHSEVLGLKSFLISTDYQAVREYEGGEPMSDEIRKKRSDARARIDELQELISATEVIEPEFPEFPEIPIDEEQVDEQLDEHVDEHVDEQVEE